MNQHFVCFVLLFILTCFFNEIPAGTSTEGYDYSHRKRNCEIRLVGKGGVPLPGALVGIAQIRNDFEFGGTICREAFDTLGDKYKENFLSYFDVGTPEKEMKWEYVMKCSEKCDPDFSKADALVDWLLEKKISARGHNLFSNEKEDYLPEWTRTLGTDAFKQAMQDRINSATSHFQGKVAQWDLINEICHGANGSLLSSGMLQTKSGDQNIFSWIMDEARKIDTVADFIINDYGLITSSDQTAADQFISKVKPLSSKFDIIGAEGHFGANMDKNSYESKIKYLVEQLGKPVLITNVDFNFDISQAPDKIEELMRTCFANPNVSGLSMGGWCQQYMPGSNLTSYFIDTLNNETSAGQRWREVRDEWKTVTGGNADDSGKFSFNGFQGKYQILISCEFDTFDLEPGEGTQIVEVVYQEEVGVNHVLAIQKPIEITINGISYSIKLPARYNRQLFLATYSLSGQQLSHSPVNPTVGEHRITLASSCCRVFRVETVDRIPLYTGKIMAVR
jgi:endo-1,4-beta-xylanase